jgi:energy-coupling factor transporter ATP-binding protein EcfA2
MPDIQINSFSFTYPGSLNPVLLSLDLKITAGEFVLVAGASGCGKSTLALALSGLIPSRIQGDVEGDVYYDGKALAQMQVHEISQHIGMVFQNPDNQLIHLDVESEVAFGPENLGLPREEIERRISETLHLTGMDKFRKRPLYSLSGGQKQRITIAAMLAMKPKVLVLDEPTSDLDPVGTQEVLKVLKELNRVHGMTVVIVEHKIDEVIPWVDRVILMDQGRVVVDAPSREAFDNLSLWDSLGVAVPQMVRLAKRLPAVYGEAVPLSVEEAVEALRGTDYESRLIAYGKAIQTGVQPSESNVLGWDGVDLAYDDVKVLRDINLQVSSGEWVALVGANGSGKTSLASLVMGFQAPTSGAVTCIGNSVAVGDISRQARQVAYLFQAADNMLFESTVEKEMGFGFRHNKKVKAEIKYSADELLEMVDLVDYKPMNPFHLSHGQRKRLAIGALLACAPKVMILDEPTTGQDDGHATQFLDFLQQLRERVGLTYLMITHNMVSVAEYASRVVVLRDGKVWRIGRPENVFASVAELAECGIVPPPVAQLHALLTHGAAKSICLNVEQFIQAIQSEEVLALA